IGVAASNQHLTEMKVSVNARHHASHAGSGESADGGDDALALAHQRLRTLAVLVALPSLLADYRLESRLNAVFGLLPPIGSVRGSGDFRGKRRSGCLARQNSVHLAKTPADRSGHGLAVRQQVGLRTLGDFRRSKRVQRAGQVVEDPRPRVAFIADETQGDGEGVRSTVRRDANDVA